MSADPPNEIQALAMRVLSAYDSAIELAQWEVAEQLVGAFEELARSHPPVEPVLELAYLCIAPMCRRD